ncbi:MAG: hypothetical protein HW397_80, partial [Dehalococcoidia bacterium]|nr:hypothetical protein [Dehalococcoidia bacterium]
MQTVHELVVRPLAGSEAEAM